MKSGYFLYLSAAQSCHQLQLACNPISVTTGKDETADTYIKLYQSKPFVYCWTIVHQTENAGKKIKSKKPERETLYILFNEKSTGNI